jgi:hypothetical protein
MSHAKKQRSKDAKRTEQSRAGKGIVVVGDVDVVLCKW